jgi:hypothetical protein
MRKLGFLTEEGVVTKKGQAAACIDATDELLAAGACASGGRGVCEQVPSSSPPLNPTHRPPKTHPTNPPPNTPHTPNTPNTPNPQS